MKNAMKLTAIGIIVSLFFSCSKDDPVPVTKTPDSNITFQASLNGSSEVPSNSSSATGTASLIYNTKTKIFTITVNYSGLTPISGHIHKGDVGVSGPPVFPFSNLTSPITYTSPALDASQEADLYANLYYVNLHTTANPNGEIRGQLIRQISSGGGYGY